ncbi:MAG: pirin family protein [Bacteroidota bacterium]
MDYRLHKADSRGRTENEGITSYHTYSFAGYYNPSRMCFGVLRAVNQEILKGGQGFSMHPHDNMEIITIPLSGSIKLLGGDGTIYYLEEGHLHHLSAGTGIFHSELNNSWKDEASFIQLWIQPSVKNIKPYQKTVQLSEVCEPNSMTAIISSDKSDSSIHQDVNFHFGYYDKATQEILKVSSENHGIYLLLLEGKARIDGVELNKMDGIEISNIEETNLILSNNSKILSVEIPLKINLN